MSPKQPSTRTLHCMRYHIARRAFSFVEVLVVVGILGLFAALVIPRLASAKLPLATPVENTLEADLRLARTEAIARAKPVVFVLAAGGDAWWIADAANPSEPIERTRREFGRGTLTELNGVTIEVASGEFNGQLTPPDSPRDAAGVHVIATFDALGTRDSDVVQFTARDEHGLRIAHWTLPAGRTRLAKVEN
jgi:prepilin-type N-terminal cleavage/methylation domain-containing protein